MSFGQINLDHAIRIIRQYQEQSGNNPLRGKTSQAIFDAQFQLARSVFGSGDDSLRPGDESLGLGGDPMLNNALMLDALRTIDRLASMNPSKAGGRGADPVRGVEASKGAESSFDSARSVESAAAESARPGSLSSRFESGKDGSAAVGYDRVGGTSYGRYQIASRTGTMDEFIDYLRSREPGWAERLEQAGAANTGSTSGAMPDAWRELAAEKPDRLTELEHGFIENSHYLPARNMILEASGVDLDAASPALREVLFSTAVQHGPTGAARIFEEAIASFAAEKNPVDFDSYLIDRVYDRRAGQFGSSSARVKTAVSNRLDRERELALAMLQDDTLA